MLTTFKNETMDTFAQKSMLAAVGFSVSGVVVLMAIYMIMHGTKRLKEMKREAQDGK